MHGTGTSLGDPIEAGAASAVLIEGTAARDAPLTFMASKSWVGHAEPGAGVVGLLHAYTALSQHAALPLQHLRSVNPHVGSIMDMSGRQGLWCLPRDLSGQPMPRNAKVRERGRTRTGIMGFPFLNDMDFRGECTQVSLVAVHTYSAPYMATSPLIVACLILCRPPRQSPAQALLHSKAPMRTYCCSTAALPMASRFAVTRCLGSARASGSIQSSAYWLSRSAWAATGT